MTDTRARDCFTWIVCLCGRYSLILGRGSRLFLALKKEKLWTSPSVCEEMLSFSVFYRSFWCSLQTLQILSLIKTCRRYFAQPWWFAGSGGVSQVGFVSETLNDRKCLLVFGACNREPLPHGSSATVTLFSLTFIPLLLQLSTGSPTPWGSCYLEQPKSFYFHCCLLSVWRALTSFPLVWQEIVNPDLCIWWQSPHVANVDLFLFSV